MKRGASLKRSAPLKQGKSLGRAKPLQGTPDSTSAAQSRARASGKEVAAGRPSVLVQRRRARRALEPGEAEWKAPKTGTCASCQQRGRVVWHHAVLEQEIRRAGGWCWDPRWAIPLCAPLSWGGKCTAHAAHHHPGVSDSRLPFTIVPLTARALAAEVLGLGPAAAHFERRYRT